MLVLIIKLILLLAILGAFFVPVYCYVIYPLLIGFFPRGRFANRPESGKGGTPMVSIIIAAYNEELHIRARIENALATDYPKDRLEILIGSDGSDDNTNAIIKEFADSRVRVFPFNERRGKVSVLNDLVAEAHGEILVFSDANTFFEATNIRSLVDRFTETNIACVCGKLIFLDPQTGKPPTNEGAYWRLETLLKTVEGTHGCILGANGANFAIRKKHFIECPTNTLVEDFLMPMLVLKDGHDVVYAPEAIATEEAAPSTEDEFRRRVRIGAGAFQSLGHLWPLLNPSRGFAAFAFFSHKVLRWLTPFIVLPAVLVSLLASFVFGGIFTLLLGIEFVFAILVGIGWAADKAGRSIGILGLPYYFFSMNVALFLGLFRWLNASQQVTWKRTPRSSNSTT